MYMNHAQFGAAKARYQKVDVTSRVEGASPHQLVAVLFEELLKSLEAMAIACRRKDWSQRGTRQARALTILSGLETSLDFDASPEIAGGLLMIYREANRLILKGGRDNDVDAVEKARALLADIASAWEAIG